MSIPLKIEGTHVPLASPEEISAGLNAAREVFQQHGVDQLSCAAAYEKMEKDELLTKDEALLCVIWDAADDKAFRAVTLGWLARDVDIRLAPGQAA